MNFRITQVMFKDEGVMVAIRNIKHLLHHINIIFCKNKRRKESSTLSSLLELEIRYLFSLFSYDIVGPAYCC